MTTAPAQQPTLQAIPTAHPPIVSRQQWRAARKALLETEKDLTRRTDALAAERRRLPMVRLGKEYRFEGPRGSVRLLDLFEGRAQLIIYHFMFDPGDPPPGQSGAPWDEGCPGCSYAVDNLPRLEHLHACDTSLALISRAPLSKIEPFRRRMGWTIPWYSSLGSDFNYDFHTTIDESVAPVEYNYKDKAALAREGLAYHLAGEQPGLSVFLRLGDEVFHTYSAYARGLEPLLTTYRLLDLTPYGRREDWEDSPAGWPQVPTMPGWIRHHDKYSASAQSCSCCHGPEHA